MIPSSRIVFFLFLAAVCILHCPLAAAFYFPGFGPKEYELGEAVHVKVQKLSSSRTQLPYDYYSLPFCAPHPILPAEESFGEYLLGDRLHNSVYKFQFRVPVPNDRQSVIEACPPRPFAATELQMFATKIQQQYRAFMLVDQLPAVERTSVKAKDRWEDVFEEGFAIGHVESDGRIFLHNHLAFTLYYHETRIVGVEVKPKNSRSTEIAAANGVLDHHTEIGFSYEVTWIPSDVRWASRWDVYSKMPAAPIHWISLLCSIAVIVALSVALGLVFMRTLRHDVSMYNAFTPDDEPEDTVGWKLLHEDVFRPPRHSSVLVSLCGSGVQLLVSCVFIAACLVLGFLSPANRGTLMTTAVIFYVLLGAVAGFIAVRLFQAYYPATFQQRWKQIAWRAGVLFPLCVLSIFLLQNLLISSAHSIGAVPAAIVFSLIGLWLGILLPSALVGAWRASSMQPVSFPTRTHNIPRQIPPHRTWYQHPWLICAVGGMFPFAVVLVELYVTLSSLWLHRVHYLFGFLAVVLLLMMVSSAQISVITTYMHLQREDYKWHWRAFVTPALSAVYLFICATVYFAFRLHIANMLSWFVLALYCLLLCMCLSVMVGAVGYLAAFVFMRKIYSAIKTD